MHVKWCEKKSCAIPRQHQYKLSEEISLFTTRNDNSQATLMQGLNI